MIRSKQAGQSLVLAALALTVLTGFAGLGIDMGVLRYDRRLQQAAADTAAIAGASDLAYSHAAALAAASAAAVANGFSDNTGAQNTPCGTSNPAGCVTVTVNNPPTSGPNSGNSNDVEVYVSQTQPTFFMRLLGADYETVTARAVATTVGGGVGSSCLYTLGSPSPSVGVNINNGSATLDAPNCAIVDNGSFNAEGSVNAYTFGCGGTAANCAGSGSVTCSGSSTCPTPNMPASGNPLSAQLTPPMVGTPTAFNQANIVPGSTYYGISINGGTVNFPAGTYVVSGNNFTIAGNATITGTGVTFYFTNGATLDASGGGSQLDIQLSAPNSGAYAGVLFYQDPKDTAGPQIGGDNKTFFQGALYFPTAPITFFGNDTFNSGAAYSIVIANSITLSGSSDVVINSNYSALPGGVSIIKNATLVE